MSTETTELTRDESLALTTYIGIVRDNLTALEDIADALKGIHSRRLYRASHATFEQFVKDTFGFGKTKAYGLLELTASESRTDTTQLNTDDEPTPVQGEIVEDEIDECDEESFSKAESETPSIDLAETSRPHGSTSFEDDADDMSDEDDLLSDLDRSTEGWQSTHGKQFVIDGLYKFIAQLKGEEMIEAKNDGGAAFPTTPQMHGYAHDSPGAGTGCGPGMSLRDWFAGQALQGDLASQSSDVGEWPDKAASSLAERCYKFADAMITARAT